MVLSVLIPLLLSFDIISKAEIGDCSSSSAEGAFVIFYRVCHDPFQKYVEEGG